MKSYTVDIIICILIVQLIHLSIVWRDIPRVVDNIICTVKPLMCDLPWCKTKTVVQEGWSFTRGRDFSDILTWPMQVQARYATHTRHQNHLCLWHKRGKNRINHLRYCIRVYTCSKRINPWRVYILVSHFRVYIRQQHHVRGTVQDGGAPEPKNSSGKSISIDIYFSHPQHSMILSNVIEVVLSIGALIFDKDDLMRKIEKR